MILPLPLHLLLHFSLAVLVGFYVGRHFKKIWLGIVAGILGGFLIDLDHVLEYFLVFGLRFNFNYFITGREFLISDKMHVWFHAWEYVPLLLLAAWLFWRKKKIAVATFLCALALGGLVHLTTDCLINRFPPQNYSLIYRWQHNFSAEILLSPEQYQKNLDEKVEMGL
jgi:hypothetical protein